MADKEVNELLNRVRKVPIGDRILNYLAQRNMMPSVQSAWLGEATTGRFTYPTASKPTGMIEYAQSRYPETMSDTLLHELVHAADYQIGKDALDYMRSDPQLYDAYLKLRTAVARPARGERLPERDPRQEMAYRMSPEWFNQYKDYRASGEELPAWGVAESARRVSSSPAPSHLNPTLAQEFDILLDLASRAKKKK